MSWKIYSLGTYGKVSTPGSKVASILSGLGYNASFTKGSDYYGTLTVTIDGVQYSANFSITSGDNPMYLSVNDETNDILVHKYSSAYSHIPDSSYLSETTCCSILSGKTASTGEAGMFTVNNDYYGGILSNWMKTYTDSEDILWLQRAIFRKNGTYVNTGFISNLFWGSMCLTPGAVIKVGADSFVCLSNCLYAKL